MLRCSLRYFTAFLLIGLGLSAVQVRADTITVGGTGSSGPLIEHIAALYQQTHPQDSVRVIAPPMGSGGALRALAAGKIDFAMAGRPLKPEEERTVGAAVEWTRTPLVFATRDGKRRAGFTRDEVAAVHLGTLAHWDDRQPIRLILRSAYESETLILRTLSPAVDQALTAALARPGMVIAENDLDTLALLEKTPGSFGTTTLGLLQLKQSTLQTLPIDGVAPTLAALLAGRYPLGKSIYLVPARSPTPAAERFAAFLRSETVRKRLPHLAYQPLF